MKACWNVYRICIIFKAWAICSWVAPIIDTSLAVLFIRLPASQLTIVFDWNQHTDLNKFNLDLTS